MFTVATFCGSKWNGWLRSNHTFDTATDAQAYADRLRSAETRAGMFRFTRRVVGA
jgi:hypothetical protein